RILRGPPEDPGLLLGGRLCDRVRRLRRGGLVAVVTTGGKSDCRNSQGHCYPSSFHPLSIAVNAHARIAAVPFTLRNLKEDLEDFGSNFDGAPDLEFRLATDALELERSGLSYQRIPPGYRFPYGHTHKTQEEVYVV